MKSLMLSILLAISGNMILVFVLHVLVAIAIYFLLNWLIDKIATLFTKPEPFSKIAKVFVAVLVVLILINAFLGLIGHAFIVW